MQIVIDIAADFVAVSFICIITMMEDYKSDGAVTMLEVVKVVVERLKVVPVFNGQDIASFNENFWSMTNVFRI